MNVVFFIVLLVLLGAGMKGYKRGMVAELNDAIALLLAIVAIVMVIIAAKSYMEHETLRTIIGIVCLTIAVLVYKITDFILSSLKLISSIPVLRGINKLLGFCLGTAEAVLLVWAGFLVLTLFQFGELNAYILSGVKENMLLTWLYQNNYLAKLLPGVMPVISAISGLGGIEIS